MRPTLARQPGRWACRSSTPPPPACSPRPTELSASAKRTAAWGLEQSQAEQKVDLAHEAVEQVSAKTDFKANAAVIKTADAMTGALLDMKV